MICFFGWLLEIVGINMDQYRHMDNILDRILDSMIDSATSILMDSINDHYPHLSPNDHCN